VTSGELDHWPFELKIGTAYYSSPGEWGAFTKSSAFLCLFAFDLGAVMWQKLHFLSRFHQSVSPKHSAHNMQRRWEIL